MNIELCEIISTDGGAGPRNLTEVCLDTNQTF